MKWNVLLLVLLIFSVFAGCNKTPDVTLPTLPGKWSLVNDSTIYHSFHTTTVNYKGLPGDYFDFRTNGKCYTKEGDVYDTLTYKILSDTSAIIENFSATVIIGNSPPSVIRPLSYHNVTITGPNQFVFESSRRRIVDLIR